MLSDFDIAGSHRLQLINQQLGQVPLSGELGYLPELS